MFKRTSTSARLTRSTMRIAGSGVAAAALIGTALIGAPQASASLEKCGDATVTYVSNGDYCEISFSDPSLNGQSANSWIVPVGFTSIDLLVVGGGGGGGGGAGGGSTSGSTRTAGGGGGGGAGHVTFLSGQAVIPGASLSFEIGEGGQGGQAGPLTSTIDQTGTDGSRAGTGGDGDGGGSTSVNIDGVALTTSPGGGGGGGGRAAVSYYDPNTQSQISDTGSSSQFPDSLAAANVGGDGGLGRISPSGGGGARDSAVNPQSAGSGGKGGPAFVAFADSGNPLVVAGGGGGGAFGGGTSADPGSGGGSAGVQGGGDGASQVVNSNGASGEDGRTAGGGGGGGGGGEADGIQNIAGGAGGRGVDGIVVIRYAALNDSPGGGGSNGGLPAPVAPAVVVQAPPSPAFIPGGATPTIARALVNGEVTDLTVTPLVNQAPEGADAQQEASLPESFRGELPGPNGVQVTAGDVGVSLVGPQVGWPRSPDVLVVAPDVPLALQTSGFSASTEVEVYVLNQGGTWVLADTLTTGPDGTLDASVTIPEDAPVGPGYLQLDGTDASGAPISLAIGAQIAPPVAPVPTADGPLPQVTPGGASATDAEGNPLVFSVDRVDGTDVEIRVGESLTSIQAVDADGLQQLGPDGAIEIEEEGFVRVGGEGFQPNSMVQVWAFSEATFVGIVLTDENGAYTSLLELPEELELGDHTLQNSGTARDGLPLAVSAGLRIIAPGEGSTPETQVQETARANTTVYFGRGSSTLDAADKKKLDRLVRRVKDSAQRVRVTGYVQASSSTANDQSLSTARARSVANYLRSQGVDAKYTIRGRGVLDAPSDEARSARVTVVYTK